MFLITLLITLILAPFLGKIFKYLSARQKILGKLANIPGPTAIPIIGNALSFNDPQNALWTFLRLSLENGRTFKLELGSKIHVITTDPRLIELVTTSETQTAKGGIYKFLEKWLDHGLLTSANPKWNIHRKLLTDKFQFDILEECWPILQKNANNLVEHLEKFDGDQFVSRSIDIHEYVALCSLDIICETATGTTINALGGDTEPEYLQHVQNLAQKFTHRAISYWKQNDILYSFSEDYKIEEKSLHYLHKFSNDILQTKKEEFKSRKGHVSESGPKKRLSFIDFLLNSSLDNGGPMSDEDIRNEVDSFMMSGQNTMASCIPFTLYLLSTHPDIQEKCYNEIMETFGSDGEITYEKLSNLKYMESVIKESLRIYPSIPLFSRELIEDLNYDGIIIPKGVQLDIFPFGLHRNPKVYENPEKFDPERFTDDECSKRNPFSYIPFSAGPRNCIGQKFAWMEMKYLISSILKTFKLTEAPLFRIQLGFEIVLKSRTGVYVVLNKRN